METKVEKHHHPAGPSKLGRISSCPGSYHLAAEAERLGVAPPTTDAAEEGTLLHRAVLEDTRLIPDLPHHLQVLANRATEYLLEKSKGSDGDDSEVLLQVKHGEAVVTFGTADYVAYWEPTEELEGKVAIIDLKFGHGEIDPTVAEAQLRAYCIGAMQKYEVEYAEAHVFHVRSGAEFSTSYRDSEEHAEEIAVTIDYAEKSPYILRPSESACKYCPARAICPALKAKVTENALMRVNPAEILEPGQLTKALILASQARAWADAVHTMAREQAFAGVQIPGYELKERNVRHVSSVAGAFTALSDLISQGEFLDCTSLSLGEVEDMAARKLKALYGMTLKDAREKLKGMLAEVVTIDTQRYLSRKGA